MSRVIKKYPYNEKYHEELTCSADTIAEIQMPTFCIEFHDLRNDSGNGMIEFKTHARAEEERQGIFVKLVGNIPTETEEVTINEIEFADELNRCVERELPVGCSRYMQDIVEQLGRDYVLNELKKNRWAYNFRYDGFGIITNNNEIISTFGSVMFHDYGLYLDHCVGDLDLNKLDNCVIQFSCQEHCFQVDLCTIHSLTIKRKGYGTYAIYEYTGKPINAIRFPM